MDKLLKALFFILTLLVLAYLTLGGQALLGLMKFN
jgi:hypothetical protein